MSHSRPEDTFFFLSDFLSSTSTVRAWGQAQASLTAMNTMRPSSCWGLLGNTSRKKKWYQHFSAGCGAASENCSYMAALRVVLKTETGTMWNGNRNYQASKIANLFSFSEVQIWNLAAHKKRCQANLCWGPKGKQILSFWESSALQSEHWILCLHTPTSSNTFWMCQTCCTCTVQFLLCASRESNLFQAWWAYTHAAHLHKSWCFPSQPESLSLYCTALCTEHVWHFCMSEGCQNFWKKAAFFTESLSLGFCEILLCLSDTNQKNCKTMRDSLVL